MTTRDDLLAMARRYGLRDPERLVALALPSLHLRATRTPSSEIPLGASRLGGVPDAPAGFVWPTRGARPLEFLAQLDLDALGAAAIPAHGSLLFFYDCEEQPWGFRPEERDAWAVVHVERATPLVRCDVPGSAVRTFASASVTAYATLDLPAASDGLVEGHFGTAFDPQWESYCELTDELARDAPHHRLLGHPRLVQGDLRGECQLAANGLYAGDPDAFATPAAKELLPSAHATWTQLLQLDSDDTGTDWMWGDAGSLYFMIRREDLSVARFDRVWLVLQCS